MRSLGDGGPDFKFNCGDEVKDTITEFSGVVVCCSHWLSNCNTYGVKSRVLKDGMAQDAIFFDEPQLVAVKKDAHKRQQGTGGPDRCVPQANR